MNIWLRMAGSSITIAGCLLLVLTIHNRHDLPKLMYVKKETVEVVKMKEATIYQPMITTLGPTTVVHRWESTFKANAGAPLGQYQFQDNNGVIVVMKFCNDPPPDFKKGTQITIHYLPSADTKTNQESLEKWGCVFMVDAVVVPGPK